MQWENAVRKKKMQFFLKFEDSQITVNFPFNIANASSKSTKGTIEDLVNIHSFFLLCNDSQVTFADILVMWS